MPSPIHIEGAWPERVRIRRGWARATARPWNDDIPDAALRLHRGSADFLAEASRAIRDRVGGRVFSPALYPLASRIWQRAGYRHFAHLEVMERPLGTAMDPPVAEVRQWPPDDLGPLIEVDGESFEEFWRMSIAGLREAVTATSRSVILVTGTKGHLTGYAIVGSRQGTAYLQRIAVAPNQAGRGLGTDLVRSSLHWAQRCGARTMVLNVRLENDRARRLYARSGFAPTATRLELLEFRG